MEKKDMNEQMCGDKKMSDHPYLCGIRCVSWSAILFSALIGFGLTFLFYMFALSIGLTAFSSGPDGNTTLAVSGFVGLVVAAFISMFIAGWLSGYLGRQYCTKRNLGEVYGFATWSVVLLLTIMLVAHVGQLLTHYNYIVDRNATVISYTSNEAAPLVSEQTKMHADDTSTTQVTVNAEKATNAVGQATFVIFFLFFIGALASMFGGRCGMSCRKSEMSKEGCVPR